MDNQVEAPPVEEKPVRAVKRKKYLAEADVVNALKKSLDTCTDMTWTDCTIILYNDNNKITYTRNTFETQMEMFTAVELAKMRFIATTAEGEHDDEQ